jgi:hypothetical protein
VAKALEHSITAGTEQPAMQQHVEELAALCRRARAA